ncbi:MAG TPA: zinc ABC transporter substrate-binding protein [Burkholderiales bacterium]|nr:zinc ABC transporter substrate-binding protein [Burkholderiales bacterium]
MRMLCFFLMLAPFSAMAALNIFACTPEWGSLAKELGGDKASVYVATTALQDPHKIEARPSLIARARNADLIVCTGAELEIGWLPLVQSQSGNAKIQAGRPGYFEASSVATMIEKPERFDRSMGDVHPLGNPHIHLDPANIAKVAAALGERMSALDAPERAYYAERTSAFVARWKEATVRWEREAAPLKGLALVVYHRDLSYLVRWLGMREVGSLEPKPGLPPSTAHLSELLARLASDPAKAVARSAYNDPRAAEWIAERAKIRLVVVPFTVGGSDRAKDLFGLYDDTIARLLEAAR